jgi:hypothetical protein
MKPVLYSEMIIHEENKKVYVYKIEQFYCSKKNKDARDIAKNLLGKIFVYKILYYRGTL